MDHQLRELTIRGIILGFLITLIFTASNIYLGLKVGLTVASSIPAAVISMGVLRYFKGSNILENNIVQSQASAAGTLSAIIFVLPALLLIGYWQRFDFWMTFLICIAGGILGVIFTVPLRHILVVESKLPYPEGIAAAEILKAGEQARQNKNLNQEDKEDSGIRYIGLGGLIAATVAFLTGGFRIISDSAAYWFKIKDAIFQVPFGLSLALMGAGYLIGIAVGTVMILGTLFDWMVLVPYFSSINPMPHGMNIQDYGVAIWKDKIRMIGVGTIGTAAIWTLLILLKAMFASIRNSLKPVGTSAKLTLRINKDISPRYLLLLFVIAILILFIAFYQFIIPINLSIFWSVGLILLVTFLSVVLGFFVAAACGYMAGILGTSSSPISGIAILAIIIVASVLLMISYFSIELSAPAMKSFLIALSIFSASVVITIAAIANDNLQDLKTGYLVGATPEMQQWALIIGCLAGALIVAPILNMLYMAYGFTDLLPRVGMDPSNALSAPQATIMATLAKGVFNHNMTWNYIFVGVAIGVAVIILDKLLRISSKNKFSFPPLAFGMGIYLPPSINTPIFFGALLAYIISKQIKNKQEYEKVNQKGMLFAAGLIVGESLMGILLAMGILVSINLGGSEVPFLINLWNDNIAQILGLIVFILILFIFYRCIYPKK